MKKTILLLAAMMMALCANLQAKITPTDSQMWWGYYTEDDGAALDYEYDGLGGSFTTFDVGIYVPAENDFVNGSTIKAIRIWLGDLSKVSGDLTLWISTTLPPENVKKSDYTQTVKKKDLVANGMNDIELTTPFEVGNRGIMVGYSITLLSKSYPIMCNGNDIRNAFLLHQGSDWYNMYGQGYGNLALQLLIEGNNFPNNNVTVADYYRAVSLLGQTVNAPVYIKNDGKDPVTEISFTVTTDGNTSAEQTATIEPLPLYGVKILGIPLEGSEAKKYEKNITITKVNGVENTATKKTSEGDLIVTSEKPAVLPVIEEFTGTWCVYCPMGIVGMQEVHEQYGDNVALIAIHSGQDESVDPMEIEPYQDVLKYYCSGFPSSVIDRDSYAEPYYLPEYMPSKLERIAQGSIGLTATWANEEKTAVKFATKSKFFYNADDEEYGIAFVLVEDGLTGSGSEWAQANYFSGYDEETLVGYGLDKMVPWGGMAAEVTGLSYDHVAVAAWETLDGFNGSVNTTIKNGEELKFSYTGDISGNTLIQDKSKLKAIAMIIDRKSGTIVNAAQVAITEGGAILGDVNGDGSVDVGDIMAVINFMAGQTAGIDEKAANVNGDGSVDVGDIMAIINIMAANN